MAFASNSRAWGICDITGFRYRLRDMKKTWNGLLVGPDQWSPKEPQLSPVPTPVDSQALKDPRPDPSSDGNENPVFQVFSGFGDGIIGGVLQTTPMNSTLGKVTVTTT
tara:strand:+ start:1461 stop:1784 length:324 start_codon:yes stop_codon:yes gene_type:complete